MSDGRIVVTSTSEITVMIPRSYEKYKSLSVTDQVVTLAIFEMTIEEESKGFFLPASIVMQPSIVQYVTINGNDYVKCTFTKGDTFIKSSNVVRNSHIAYVVFTEYVEKGQIPEYMTYDNLAFLFDIVKRITGCSIPAEHATFEMVYAYLARAKNSLKTPYRLTSMHEPPVYLKLKDVPHAASSTTARLIGSYLNDGIASGMVNAAEDTSDIEELLRH
jgi:hypothetical protein